MTHGGEKKPKEDTHTHADGNFLINLSDKQAVYGITVHVLSTDETTAVLQ